MEALRRANYDLFFSGFCHPNKDMDYSQDSTPASGISGLLPKISELYEL